ncbi:hypothetical protein GTY70_02570 [Stenotrophomonas maltophilia]|nr:hypothetical protein [Stenotrophomonas maltophilia]MCF3507282.1 hypothetical protein [Stenotrophomonas maltophilia]
MNARIYDRPDLDQRTAQLALHITGAFRNAKPGVAYEGRLLVHNGIGGLTVDQIDGDRLPNGTSLYMAGSEIVLAWPDYSETAAAIPNPGYEDGDTGWEKGQGWSIGTENPIAGARSARYGETQGSSLIESAARYPVNPGLPITATCQVRQGASAEGNAGAAVQLQWRRADGSLLDTSEGNAVMSASKNRVYPSTVVAVPPAGAALVNVASRGIRTRENKALFIDSFVWDHQQLTGVNVTRTYDLTLRVRDSAGRSALWRGMVKVELIQAPTWSPTAHGDNFTITDGLVATAANGDTFGFSSTAALSTSAKSAGKWYVEIQCKAGSAGNVTFRAGVARSTHPLQGPTVADAGLGASSDSWCMLAANGECYFNGNFLYFGSVDLSIGSPTDRWGIAYDAGTGRLWLRKVGVGAWRGGGDPASNTTPSYVAEPGLHFAASLSSLGGSPEGEFTIVDAAQATIPAGFAYWTD